MNKATCSTDAICDLLWEFTDANRAGKIEKDLRLEALRLDMLNKGTKRASNGHRVLGIVLSCYKVTQDGAWNELNQVRTAVHSNAIQLDSNIVSVKSLARKNLLRHRRQLSFLAYRICGLEADICTLRSLQSVQMDGK